MTIPGGWPWDFWTINSMTVTSALLGLVMIPCLRFWTEKDRAFGRGRFQALIWHKHHTYVCVDIAIIYIYAYSKSIFTFTIYMKLWMYIFIHISSTCISKHFPWLGNTVGYTPLTQFLDGFFCAIFPGRSLSIFHLSNLRSIVSRLKWGDCHMTLRQWKVKLTASHSTFEKQIRRFLMELGVIMAAYSSPCFV